MTSIPFGTATTRILLLLLVVLDLFPRGARGWVGANYPTPSRGVESYPDRLSRGSIVSSVALLASSSSSSSSSTKIDYQSHRGGRGMEHLTAELQPGDVVVFQTGTWYVDGVAVGDGQAPAWEYCLVDTIQIVWSHNCEHGVVRGFALTTTTTTNDTKAHDGTTLLKVADYDTMIDFGPEQLVARIPVKQESDDTFRAPMELSDALWQEQEPA